jgi:hypothetical protein
MMGTRPERKRMKLRRDDSYWQDLVRKARNMIYDHSSTGNKSAGVQNAHVERLLKCTSLVPVQVLSSLLPTLYVSTDHSVCISQNAFSDKLSRYGFNFHEMLAPDILHECLLGTWKNLFVTLLRLLMAINPNAVVTLDSRCVKDYVDINFKAQCYLGFEKSQPLALIQSAISTGMHRRQRA